MFFHKQNQLNQLPGHITTFSLYNSFQCYLAVLQVTCKNKIKYILNWFYESPMENIPKPANAHWGVGGGWVIILLQNNQLIYKFSLSPNYTQSSLLLYY